MEYILIDETATFANPKAASRKGDFLSIFNRMHNLHVEGSDNAAAQGEIGFGFRNPSATSAARDMIP